MTGAEGSPATERPYLPVLDVCRVVAVLGVVAIHVLAGAEEVGVEGPGRVVLAVLDAVLVAAVPAFFLISGALGLDPRAQRHGPAEYLRRRAVRILPPLLVWSVLCIIVLRIGVMGRPTSALDVLDMLVTGQTAAHLYFLFALAGLTVITPVIQPFLAVDEGRRAWMLGLVATGWTVVTMAIGRAGELGVLSTVPLQLGTTTFFLAYLGYYVLGRAVLVRPLPRRAAIVAVAVSPLLAGVVAVLALATREAAGTVWAAVLAPSYVALPVVLYSVVLMTGVLSLGRSWRVGPEAGRRLRRAGESTFGVFLVHFPIMVLLRELVPGFGGTGPLDLAALWAVTVVLSAGFALLGERVPGLRRVV